MRVCKSTITGFFLALLVSGCVTGPDNAKTVNTKMNIKSQFWSSPNERGYCFADRELKIVDADMLTRKILGWEDGGGGNEFLQVLGYNVAALLGNKKLDATKFARNLEQAASAYAYIQPDYGRTSRDASPVYMQSLIMISLSYAVSYFDENNVPYNRAQIIKWGNLIDESQSSSMGASKLDSIAAIAAARTSWGAATQQPAIFDSGLSKFHAVASQMDSNAEIHDNTRKYVGLRDFNDMLQYLVVAAEAAERNGVPAYSFKYNGKTLHDAVNRNAMLTAKYGGKIEGFVNHIGWAPIYASRFPNTTAAANLKFAVVDMEELNIKNGYPKGFDAMSMGGPVGCLWGYR